MGVFKDAADATEKFFRHDYFAADNNMKIDLLDDETCVCSMELDDRHKNATGHVMGGVIFTIADLAFAASANNIHNVTVTQQVSLNFLNGSRGSKLFAKTKIIKNGRMSCVINVDVTDDSGKLVAQYVGTGSKV